jgi:hypothetical protein
MDLDIIIGIILTVMTLGAVVILNCVNSFVSDLLEIMKGAAKEKSKFAQVS